MLAFALAICPRSAEAQVQLRAAVYATGFSSPVAFVQDPTNHSIQYVVEQGGRIRVVRNGSVLSSDFLNLAGAISSGGERGLLGMTFSPDYASSGRFYVNFTNPEGHTVIARFRRSANAQVADASSRFDLDWGGLTGPSYIAQPFANHNGGHLAFGPDGFLYIGLGDGGAGNDPAHIAQNPTELLGKMIRVDVNVPDVHPIGYQVPPGNPFIGTAARPEIWSFGLRNPWRYSFDDVTRGGTGALIIGDVGQNRWEEIDYEPANRGGRNYGWRNREGAHPNIADPPPAASAPLVDPIHEYDHDTGASVTGGYVYRGRLLGPAHRGRYFFADLTGRVWSLALAINPGTGEAEAFNLLEHTQSLGGSGQLGLISSFGTGWDGELYVVGYSRGTIFKIVPSKIVPAREGDFDGDGKADITVFRPHAGTWYRRGSSVSATDEWGGGADVPVAADYDGDGKTDIAVYRPSTGTWYIINSSTMVGSVVGWGGGADIPVPADYDGDGKVDIGVYRPSTGIWYIINSSSMIGSTVAWGGGNDIPVPQDYDGDGKSDIGVYRPSTGVWYLIKSSAPAGSIVPWGGGADVPVPADYDGDGRADIAVFRPSTGAWYVINSATMLGSVASWGGGVDIPVPGDYDGDGQVDISVFRPSTGAWYTIQSSIMLGSIVPWGGASDIPMLKRP